MDKCITDLRNEPLNWKFETNSFWHLQQSANSSKKMCRFIVDVGNIWALQVSSCKCTIIKIDLHK